MNDAPEDWRALVYARLAKLARENGQEPPEMTNDTLLAFETIASAAMALVDTKVVTDERDVSFWANALSMAIGIALRAQRGELN